MIDVRHGDGAPALDSAGAAGPAAATAADGRSGQDYANPFLGPASFGPEDGGVFFGREIEAGMLSTLVLANRVSFLYAASGAGKSSLLAARLQPILEMRGWLPVEIRLSNEPVAAARQAVMLQAVLHPELELACLDELIALVGEQIPLPDVPDAVQRLPNAMPAKRRMLQRRVFELAGEKAPALPMLARLARGGLAASDYFDALRIAVAEGPGELALGATLPLAWLRGLLTDPAVVLGHQRLVQRLVNSGPGLLPLLDALDQVAERSVRSFPLVLIFDQFEELFTRFADVDPSRRGTDHRTDHLVPEAGHMADWRQRQALTDELAALFGTTAQGQPARARPHRLLISLREDFIAELAALPQVAVPGPDNAFRLAHLAADYARLAITQPLEQYGWRAEPACVDAVVEGLLRENRYVEAAPLQVVCSRLWKAAHEPSAGGAPLPVPVSHERIIRRTTLMDTLEGVPSILSRYFSEELEQGVDALVRHEVLDLLAPLITANGKRNIVEKRTLLSAPFHDGVTRARALQFLLEHNFVRVEWRLRSEFVEIAHEFQIASMLAELARREQRSSERSLQRALAELTHRQRALGGILASGELGQDEFGLLHEVYCDRELHGRIAWTAELRQLMLRAALFHAREAGRDAVRTWVRDAAADTDADGTASWQALRAQLTRRDRQQPLTRAEWDRLTGQWAGLSAHDLAAPTLLHAAVAYSNDDGRDRLRALVRTALTAGGRAP